MTTELTSHLTLIRTHCTTVIEQANLATIGPWKISAAGGPYVFGDEGAEVCKCDSWQRTETKHKSNALFIATSRQFTPAAAEAVLVALEYLCNQAEQTEVLCKSDNTPVHDALQSLADKFDYLWK